MQRKISRCIGPGSRSQRLSISRGPRVAGNLYLWIISSPVSVATEVHNHSSNCIFDRSLFDSIAFFFFFFFLSRRNRDVRFLEHGTVWVLTSGISDLVDFKVLFMGEKRLQYLTNCHVKFTHSLYLYWMLFYVKSSFLVLLCNSLRYLKFSVYLILITFNINIYKLYNLWSSVKAVNNIDTLRGSSFNIQTLDMFDKLSKSCPVY